MSEFDSLVSGGLPGEVLQTLEHFENAFGAVLVLTVRFAEPSEAERAVIYESKPGLGESESMGSEAVVPYLGYDIKLQVRSARSAPVEAVCAALAPMLTNGFNLQRETDYFANELLGRWEEISLLYDISKTLGSTIDLEASTSIILSDVRDVLGAKRGSVWVHESRDDNLHCAAEVGEDGRSGVLRPDDPDAITAMVFREGLPVITTTATGDSHLAVPLQYSPGTGGSRSVGVINLIGRLDGGPFTPANRNLLVAIATQIAAAIENIRLVRESVSKERMSREMELAHDLQMKLLPAVETFGFTKAAGRVQPAEQVGGDFYQLFELPEGRIGAMLGDVSLHGFPSALIMMLTMSAAGIYAQEAGSPALVLRKLDDALSDELETTEMFLTLFYGVIDPARGELTYANAGHPHAFVIRSDGEAQRLVATDPPVGFAGSDSYAEETVSWSSDDDLLLLFTDGLSDTLATKGLKNGEAQVLEAAIGNRSGSVSQVIDALFALSNDTSMSALADDRAALVVRG